VTDWQVVHLNLREDPGHLPVIEGPAYLVFWWGCLPIGTQARLREELPLRPPELVELSSGFIARQLACRLGELGGPALAGGDARPQTGLTLEATVAFENYSAIDSLSVESSVSPGGLSVIVCTRDRPEDLERCLRALQAQRRAPMEIIVVDNAPAGTAEPICARIKGVRYVHEPRAGLSVARNTGIASSCGELVAFTDDDVEVHENWASELARVFAEQPDIDAVTGLVLPSSLDTRARRFFQFEMGGFGSGYVPLRFEQCFLRNQLAQGPQVWRIGAGANMAFRRAVFDRIGLFDERLGAGASGCSEDSELWYRILAADGHCLYEPRAVVFHHHRASWDDLLRQMRAYMKGHVSALVAQADLHGHQSNLRRVFVQLPGYFWRTFVAIVRDGAKDRGRILIEEVLGWLAGLQYVVRWGWRRRRAADRVV
jgi:GT2 family glycosyltransferase